jgi:hypothetical protein
MAFSLVRLLFGAMSPPAEMDQVTKKPAPAEWGFRRGPEHFHAASGQPRGRVRIMKVS